VDAVRAGENVYVGRVLHNKNSLPVSVRASKDLISAADGNTVFETTEFEVTAYDGDLYERRKSVLPKFYRRSI
jgi:hypothetical protein